jgi:AraC-like DNA-binding protein
MAATMRNISKRIQVRGSERVTFGDVLYAPNGAFGPRTQLDFQLVAVHSGEAVITVDGAGQHLPAGRIALLRPGHRESFTFSRATPTHHTWCAIDVRRVAGSLREDLIAAPWSLPLTARLQRLIDLGLTSPAAASPVTAALIDKLGDALLQEYLAEATLGGEQAAPLPEAVRRAKDRIDLDPAAACTMADLSQVACCTPNHLIKLFRRHLGITPARYLWQTRVERGVGLLRQTGLSISEIAYRTGFQTPFHFSRLVKQQHQRSPKELRARAWNAGRPAREHPAGE